GLWAARWVERAEDHRRALGRVLLGTGASLLAGLMVAAQLGPALGPWASSTLLPATFGMGATFPLLVRLVAGGGASSSRSVGNTSAASTVGAVGGSLAGAALLPAVGAASSIFGVLAVYAVLGAALGV